MFEDVPSQLQDAAHHTDHDLNSGGRDVDDAPYRHMPRFTENSVRMVASIGDSALLVGARGLPLRPAELRYRHLRDSHPRRALAIEAQPLRDGGRGIDDAVTVERT